MDGDQGKRKRREALDSGSYKARFWSDFGLFGHPFGSNLFWVHDLSPIRNRFFIDITALLRKLKILVAFRRVELSALRKNNIDNLKNKQTVNGISESVIAKTPGNLMTANEFCRSSSFAHA